MYDVHHGLIGMNSGFPISVNWTFFARCYGWGATSENRLKISDFDPTQSVWPKISGRRGRPQPFYKKTRRNDHSFIKIWTGFSSVLSQFTRLTDRQTDGRTKFSSLDRVCILCSAVKIKLITSELQCSVFVCLLVYSVQSCIRRRSINTRRRPQPNRSRQMTRLNESKEPNSLSSTPSFVNIQHAKYRVLTGQRFSTERART